MITNDERKFIEFWKEKRLQNKLNPFLFGKGFAIGTSIGILITICFSVGWNKQVPDNAMNIPVVVLAFVCIAFFCAIFYNNFKYEQNEQFYLELQSKMSKVEKEVLV